MTANPTGASAPSPVLCPSDLQDARRSAAQLLRMIARVQHLVRVVDEA